MLTPANISWRGGQRDGQPYADDYGDIYFSKEGIDEVARVFMAPCGLPERAGERVIVGELGFGTGLNFAVCATRILADSKARLHFVSFEKHPLRAADWQRVADQYGTQLPIYRELVATPLPVLPGWQRRVLAGGRITLSVYHGDVADGLADLAERQTAGVDAWFLDGFAPAANPDMWSETVCALLARTAASGCRIATFSAAGAVRRGLAQAGFAMQKVDQRPFKRESLSGTLADGRKPASPPRHAAVFGAGIGGACVARHLADAGIDVHVFDPAGIAGGASAIPCAVLHGRLLGDGSAAAAWRAAAFHYASAYLHDRRGVSRTGALQLQSANMDAAKLARIATAYAADSEHQQFWLRILSAAEASATAGLPIEADCFYFPTAGVVNLPETCEDLLDHPRIVFHATAGSLTPEVPTVICAGSAARTWCDWLEVADVHGQLDRYEGSACAALPIVGNGYLVPHADGCTLGATYEYAPWEGDRAVSHNLEQNRHLVDASSMVRQASYRGARAVTSDRLPIIGRLADNLWIASGYGSMGTTAAPLGGAMISAALLGEMAPVSVEVNRALDPLRFKVRQARRGVRHR